MRLKKVLALAALAFVLAAMASCKDSKAVQAVSASDAKCSLSYLKDVTEQKNYELEMISKRDFSSSQAD